jgi:anti-sigma regulatory factor (Ser/Thr protein kinase)
LPEALSITLEPQPVNAGKARRFVVDAVHRLGCEIYAEVAELLASELVTNVILHARTPLTVRVLGSPERVRVEVVDASEKAPARQHFSSQATTGRGLDLVEFLAADWGADSTPSGKVVWFELEGDDERVNL